MPDDGLGRIAFFGRTLADYETFLDFKAETLLGERILDVAAGTSSFTAEFTVLGGDAVAVDPVYRLRLPGVRERAMHDFRASTRLLAEHPERFALNGLEDLEGLLARRRQSRDRFLADFVPGSAAGRYRGDALPSLEFPDQSFDRVFCGHFLFLYAEYFSFDFHLAALREMLRVARREVRIYPLSTMRDRPYERLGALLEALGPGVAVRRQSLTSSVLKSARECLILSRQRSSIFETS